MLFLKSIKLALDQFGQKNQAFDSGHILFKAYLKQPEEHVAKSVDYMSLEFKGKARVEYFVNPLYKDGN